ncbi:MAG: hypothetical protein HF978_15070 [Desulfobacteraceae bacterium]|nr:hypothetical protein [Desulfobacteraceae bacterium]MBC2756862.1 hypothetical protein [Desulfobacteraceae bacterium]
MDLIEIQYIFKINGLQETVDLQLDAANLEIANKPGGELPAWANLKFDQCPHCPLDTGTHPCCPVAESLVDVVARFDKILSYDEVDLEIITSERKVFQRTTAQRAISSLLGVLFPVSGCPHTAFFKPMVRFHLPMATRQETIFRATGMYLMAQYYLEKQGREVDSELTGLAQIYKNLNIINIHMAERLRSATRTDSSVNAVIILDVFAQALPFVIDDQLEEIRYLFAPYFSDLYQSIIGDIK